MTANSPSPRVAVAKLTADELAGLAADFNLADAHTHQSLSEAESKIAGSLAEIFLEAQSSRQQEVDLAAAEAFLRLSAQSSAIPIEWYLPVYSSSISLEIIANAFRIRGRQVMLIEPTFDNLADIIRRQEVPVVPVRLPSHGGYSGAIARALAAGIGDVLMLVLPNNPTGHRLSPDDFRSVAASCREKDVVLCLDFTFRTQDSLMSYDQYEILQETGVEYIVIEDTGKVWPTLDLKLSYILASRDWRELLEDIQQDLLLNVSRFVSCLVRHFSENSVADDLDSVRSLIRRNRAYLRDAIVAGLLPLSVPNQDSAVSVEFLRLESDLEASKVLSACRVHGVSVLSGAAFYWSEPSAGDQFIRIALARDEEYFKAGIDRLSIAMNSARS